MKVLILAYDFPPYVSVGGLRPYSWYRYLGEFGVAPVVVTRQWANQYGDERDYIAPGRSDREEVEESEFGTIVRTPHQPNLGNRLMLSGGPEHYPLVRRLVSAWCAVCQYYAAVGPKKELYKAARRYLRDHRVDAIVATGDPFVLFRYAALLSHEFGVPWVADYRDLWTQDLRRVGPSAYLKWEERVERRVTASASLVTAVSDSVVETLAGIHSGKPIEVIPNGYDPEAMATGQSIAQGRERCTIAFTGSIYGWYPLQSVFGVFDDFVAAHPETPLALKMIGVGGAKSLEASMRSDFPALAHRTTFVPRLPNEALAPVLAEANAFLMFNNYAYSGTKVFDYMALRRRILLCYSEDPEAAELKERHYNLEVAPGTDERVLEGMIRETRSGVVVRDAADLKQVLAALIGEFETNRSIACASVGVEQYSRRTQAERLAQLLRGLVK